MIRRVSSITEPKKVLHREIYSIVQNRMGGKKIKIMFFRDIAMLLTAAAEYVYQESMILVSRKSSLIGEYALNSRSLINIRIATDRM